MTDTAQWPAAVFSRQLAEAVRGRRERSAVFTTFNFDPGFFELQVLPLLFSQSFSQADKVRLLQLEDALRDVDHLAVYYDRGALSQDAEPARLDYRRIDVRRATGVFHPKLAFLLVDEPKEFDDDSDETRQYQSLVVACLSANLSRAGWWENVECAHIEEIQDRDCAPHGVSYLRDLHAILRRVRACAAEGDDHRALDAVHAFLRDRVPAKRYVNARAGGRWYTRVFGGEGRLDLAHWLAELGLGRRGRNLEVISPYFDARGAAPLKRLTEVIAPRETRVYLPRDAGGSALVTAEAYRATAALDGVRWAELPDEITRRSGGAHGDRLAPRRVHGKVYRLWRRGGGDIVLVGSVNCTSPAHRHGGGGNLEAAFLVDISDERLPKRWWLKPLGHDAESFLESAPDETDGMDNPPFGVSIRYDWGESRLHVRFEKELALPIEVTEISGRHLFAVDHSDIARWSACDENAADAVRESLASSSFLVIRRDDTHWRVLVREEGMAHRPSILSELSPDEILEYWSLLSAEERAAFIERHLAFGEEIEGIPAAERDDLPGTGDTLFDRFAGVFHAFGCLRRNIEKALADGRHDEAEMRLLGAKYDSLPELLRKTLEREDGDPVLGYVTFLTAKQIRGFLDRRDPQFFRDRRSLVRKLDRLIATGIERRDRISPTTMRRLAHSSSGLSPSSSRTWGTCDAPDHPRVSRRADQFRPLQRGSRQGVRVPAARRYGGGVQHAGAKRVRVPRRRGGDGQDIRRPRGDEPVALLRSTRSHCRDHAAREHPAQMVKELHNFVARNWRVVGNRVKSLRGGPVWEPVVCNSLVEFAHEALVNQDRDFFLRMTSFSIRLSDPEDRRKMRGALLDNVPWLERRHVPNYNPDDFRDAFSVALNGVVPEADLVIFDESQNLKHGFRTDGSTRNRVMGLAFGHPDGDCFGQPWYMKKAKRVLLLSATPFEDDYAAIQRQLAVFGFGDAILEGASSEVGISVAALADPEIAEDEKRRVAQRLLIRRVSGLNIAGRLHTKNMYRREWRRGGLEHHDEPIEIVDPRQRLIVALMQKKVAEVLQTERFNNHFQIGMLSSFESFLQSVETARRRHEEEPAFDGEEQRRGLSDRERNGIDTEVIGEVVRSFRATFGSTLPHPKLDTTATALSGAFETGEKTLAFVRRVATVDELAAKLDESFDAWIQARMEARLPVLHEQIGVLFELYARERLRRPEEIESVHEDDAELSSEQERIDRRDDLEEDDEGGAENFFAWFFRGNGPSGVLSGAAFQKNRLSSTSSAYATLFEDDYVASLLGVEGGSVLKSLAQVTGETPKRCGERLQRLAFGFFQERSRRREGYPRLYVFEGYQAAGLTLLREQGGEPGEQAEIILEERFPDIRPAASEPPAGFPAHGTGLGITTVFTELRRRPALREHLWPESICEDFQEAFRRREQRRELLSAMTRLGAPYIDLYLLAIARIGAFTLGQRRETESATELAVDFVAMLERQKGEPGFHACQELSQAAEAFNHIMSVNFPETPSCPLPELARLYGVTLQKQVPVGRMSGGVNQRLVRQFRMPGFPLVLVTTDVLQEGEDLQTCTPSADALCTTVSRGRLRRLSSAQDAWTESAAWCSVASTVRLCRLRPTISSKSTIRTCVTPLNSCRYAACSDASTDSCA